LGHGRPEAVLFDREIVSLDMVLPDSSRRILNKQDGVF